MIHQIIFINHICYFYTYNKNLESTSIRIILRICDETLIVNCTDHLGFSGFDSSNIVSLLCVSTSLAPHTHTHQKKINQVDNLEHLIRTGFGIKEPPVVASSQDEEMLKMQNNSRFVGKRWTLVEKEKFCVLVLCLELNWTCEYVVFIYLQGFASFVYYWQSS